MNEWLSTDVYGIQIIQNALKDLQKCSKGTINKFIQFFSQ